MTGRGEQREGMDGIPVLVERSAKRCASTARKGVANRSENTEPEIAAQLARRVPDAFEPRSAEIVAYFGIPVPRVVGILH